MRIQEPGARSQEAAARRQKTGARSQKKKVALRLSSLLTSVFWLLSSVSSASAQDADPILRAMKDELERSRQLRIVSLDPPYFFEYRIEDTKSYTIAATLGALVGMRESDVRIPMVRVRVGDYSFDLFL